MDSWRKSWRKWERMDWGEGRVFERQKARMGQDNVTTHLCYLLHICTSAIAALLSSHLLQDRVWKRWGPHLGTSQKCLRILMLGIFISGSMELMAARTEVWVPLQPCQSTPHQLRGMSSTFPVFIWGFYLRHLWAAAAGVPGVKSDGPGSFPNLSCDFKQVSLYLSLSFLY